MHYAPHGRLSEKSLEALESLQREPPRAIGLDVVAKSDGLLSNSSIYVVLGDLEEQGLVRASASGPPVECRGPDIRLPLMA